ncbi:hypothetical protein B4098_2216 [Heyndrickxia coagulans]|uniref:Uncharacterized protein n=1 Tax=Heyndrickxia coagulans TaxID=1398 RepID=A0A150K044_HEYCO|nr:hypothetical protein B4098_2216 [Heyndrickxia coagulans]KYC71478.1 hypothetical protein B4099_2375 [Heyndrickxia coagulans]
MSRLAKTDEWTSLQCIIGLSRQQTGMQGGGLDRQAGKISTIKP